VTYWEKIGDMNRLIRFATEWRTIEDMRAEFGLTPAESWKVFRKVVKVYEEFEYRDANGMKAGCPNIFKATKYALKLLKK